LRIVADKLSKELNKVEDDVYKDRGKEVIRELAHMRRNVLYLRRMLDPQRGLITSLGSAKDDFIRTEFDPYFDDIKDELDKIWVRLENFKDTIDGLYETNESLLTYKTNEIIKILTIFSVTLMPPTLLSGVFGMNIPLPFADQPFYIWGIFGLIFISLGIALVFLKRKKWY